MPNIDINIWAKIHPRSLNRSKKDLNTAMQDMGREAGENLTKGIEKEAPRVRRAILGMADASAAHAKQTRDLSKAQGERAQVTGRLLELDAAADVQKRRNLATGKAELVLEKQLRTSKGQVENATADLMNKEAEHNSLRLRHARNNEFLRQSELTIKEARLRGTMTAEEIKEAELELIPLRRQVAAETEKLARSERSLSDDRDRLRNLGSEAADIERDLGKARKEGADGAKELERIENEINNTREQGSKLDEDIVRRNDEVTRSNDKRKESVRRLNEAHEAEEKRRRNKRGHGGNFARGVGNILTDIPGVPSGKLGAVIGGPIIIAMASAAEAVVTASQALAIAPAIITAAGAAFGTLAMGMNGFGDAVKNMGDPKKFAEALQSLSPAAQQAALEIKYLVDGPLGDLQNATQETLFKGIAEQFHNLTNELLPEARTLTRGVAGSFNNMFGNFTEQLMSPGSQQSIDNIINNIVVGFQRLEPAVAPFTDAMTKIIETGSSFLPGFGDAITNAANSFSNFITKAQADGSLQQFMQKGVDAAVALSKTIWDIGQRIFETFGNKSPEEFQANLNAAIDAAFGLANAVVTVSNAINNVTELINQIPGGINTVLVAFLAWKTIPGVIGLIASLGKIGSALAGLPAIAARAGTGISGALAAVKLPTWLVTLMKWGGLLGVGLQSDQKDSSELGLPQVTQGPDGRWSFGDAGPGDWQSQVRPNPDRIADHKGLDGIGAGSAGGISIPALPDADAGLGPWNPFDVPGVPEDGGRKPSAKDRREAIWNTLDPNAFMPNVPQLAPGNGDPQKVWDAQYDMVQKARDLRDAKMDLAVLERDDAATQEEILKAKEKIQDKEHAFQESQLKAAKAQQGKLERVKNSADKLGAGLDADLGLSRGLAGLADNLVRFVGNLATAPLQAMLQRQIDANPNEGSGLIGILAAQGKFGEQYTPGYIAANGSSGTSSLSGLASQAPYGSTSSSVAPSMGVSATGPGQPYGLPNGTDIRQGAAGFPSWVYQVANAFGLKASTYSGHQEDRGQGNQGIDWWGPVENRQRFAEWLAQNRNIPGLEDVIYENPSTGQDIGVNKGRLVGTPGSSDPGYFRRGKNDFADHRDHVHTTQQSALPLPGGGYTPSDGAMPGMSTSGLPSSGGGTPVYVMNWPGGFSLPGSSGANGPAAPGSTVAGVTVPSAAPGGLSADQWNKIAGAESGGDWKINTGNGFYGGLQFQQSTWDEFGGGKYAPRADLASPQEQMDIANKVFAKQGGGAWPATSTAHPDWFKPGGGGSTLPGTGAPQGMPNIPNTLAPNAGAMAGQGLGPMSQPYQPTPQNQPQPQWQPSGGGGGGGGLLGMAAGAMGAMVPGGGAAAQLAMALTQRTIKYGGEVAGALAQGALSSMSVSDPDGGGGTDLSQSWIGRLAGSMASAAPALPSSAGKADQQQQNQQQQGDPKAQQGQQGGPQSPLIGNMYVQADKATGQSMANEMAYASASAGLSPGS